MSLATYTVSLSAETAERLKVVAESQGLSPDAAIADAIEAYLAEWEQHAADLDEAGREVLPWLKASPED
jgi:predicted DNA-binding protein